MPADENCALIKQWARALASQCRAALTEMTTLAPWLQAHDLATWSSHFSPLSQLLHGPLTLRHIAQLEILTQPFFDTATNHAEQSLIALTRVLQEQIKTASAVATARIHQIDLLVMQAGEFSRMNIDFCIIRRLIYWRSDTTSQSTDATPDSTICWLRKHVLPPSSASPWGNCRKRAGSPWDGN